MTLLKNIIAIPERVHHGDFVLRLAEGIAHRDETLDKYVVTDQLAECFDRALALIKSSVESGSSKAAYLHGSFGSGKSHFMAVLHLLLLHDAKARAIPELAAVVQDHSPWLEGKQILLVPYHMIGADSLESALFRGYVDRVHQLKPDAPLPAVFLADKVFEDAKNLRQRMGDASFFAGLNEGREAGGEGWGSIGVEWDATRFDEALVAPVDAESRGDLARDLVGRYFQAYGAVGGEEAFVDLDRGLAAISRHAKSLGYDGIVLFLDELILWLASRVADLPFVGREAAKVAKLVESASSDRPAPIVSFVARQRDLRELVGSHVPGSEKLGFVDSLNHQSGRFETITLEDRNLPVIAEKRLLKPVDDAAKAALDQAFRETEQVRDEIMNVLLTRSGDKGMFRRLYPFSPALVSVLVAVSSALQRERTALRVMLQLLVNQRETLSLGQVVPVGDLFDVIAENDEPFTEEMRRHFENTKKLYETKLRPLLEEDHKVRYEALDDLPTDDPRVRAYRADDRLIKTMLLAALVPEEESLKGLTADRLAALNHGTIRTPIPGREAQEVVRRCRQWAAAVGEIKIGEGSNPTLGIQVTGVDTESILEKLESVDNRAARIRKVKQVLFAELGVKGEDLLGVRYGFRWRGTAREADVVFGNVRDFEDDVLRATGETWKVVFDFPFDEEGRTARDDLARIDQFVAKGESSRTVCWLPAFFSREMQGDLKTLVILDHALASDERFADAASHLAQVERQAAKQLLRNQQSVLQNRLVHALEAAFGIASAPPRTLESDLEPEDRIRSLFAGFSPRVPVGASLSQAFEQLLGQMLAHQYPAHPEFERDIKTSELQKVLDDVRRAVPEKNGRIEVDVALRPVMRQIANPLKLGVQHEKAFLLEDHWRGRLRKKAREDEGPLTVAKVRCWLDEPVPMGLPREVANLLIWTYAEQSGKTFHGPGAGEASLGFLDDEWELRDQKLPTAEEWKVASEVAARTFGLTVSPLMSAHNVGELGRQLGEMALEYQKPAERLVGALEERLRSLGLDVDDSARMKSAREVVGLLARIRSAPPEERVNVLVKDQSDVQPAILGKSLKSAESVAAVVESTDWQLFESVAGLGGEKGVEGRRLKEELCSVLVGDELTKGLVAKFDAAKTKAYKIITHEPDPVWKRVDSGTSQVTDPTQLDGLVSELAKQLEKGGERRLNLDWSIEEKDVKEKGASS